MALIIALALMGLLAGQMMYRWKMDLILVTVIVVAMISDVPKPEMITARDGTRAILQSAGLSFLFGMLLGDFVGGGAVVIGAGLFDMVDGRVARETNRVTRFGGFFDSVLDRYSDLALLIKAFVSVEGIGSEPGTVEASTRAMPLTSPAGFAAVTMKPKKTLPCASMVRASSMVRSPMAPADSRWRASSSRAATSCRVQARPAGEGRGGGNHQRQDHLHRAAPRLYAQADARDAATGRVAARVAGTGRRP